MSITVDNYEPLYTIKPTNSSKMESFWDEIHIKSLVYVYSLIYLINVQHVFIHKQPVYYKI